MGTLGNQPARNHFDMNYSALSDFLEDAAEHAKKYEISIETVVAAKQALELERKNNIAVQSGDYADEQAGGIGDILSLIANAIEGLKT